MKLIRTLLIDNYDSFTYNLYHLIATVNHCPPVIIKNDDPHWNMSLLDSIDNIVISPGPGRPDRLNDFGLCHKILAQKTVPILGICLGHQGIGHFYGAHIDLAIDAQHGRLSRIFHNGSDLFDQIPSPFTAVRYHSLAVSDLPDSLIVTAKAEDGTIMGIRHRTIPQWGVQFHPESICTDFGLQLLENFRKITENWHQQHHRIRSESLFFPTPTHPDISQHQSAKSHLILLHEHIPCNTTSEILFDRFFRNTPYAIWLDSSQQNYGSGRFSFLCKPDGPLGRIATVDVHAKTVCIETQDRKQLIRTRFFEWLEKDLNQFNLPSIHFPFEFSLGWIGYIGYEIKADCGSSNNHHSPYPDAILLFCDRGIVIDHQEKQVFLLALANQHTLHHAQNWIRSTRSQLKSIVFSTLNTPDDLPDHLALITPLTLRHNKQQYIDLIQKSQAYIQQGETYEVCLTNTVTGKSKANPWIAYRMLRRANPTPYGAYLQLKDLYILSGSPERFLKISCDRIAESKPIKGTRKRSTIPEKDRQLQKELSHSEKEQAENLMIVDLVRHDLGQTAELNSVAVPKLFAIESYPTVHQMVSTITSKIRSDLSPCQCVRAAFPGGSMTGAPKLRTMRILDELEKGPRGIYSGVIGYFSLCGAVDLSIVIRTLVMLDENVSFGVGGAITSLSNPEEEFEEIRTKAKAFLDLFNTDFPSNSS